jgi:hypothetical protein
MSLGLPDPHPDPLVRGSDPRIRIQIRTKMSRIRNTVESYERMLALGSPCLTTLASTCRRGLRLLVVASSNELVSVVVVTVVVVPGVVVDDTTGGLCRPALGVI